MRMHNKAKSFFYLFMSVLIPGSVGVVVSPTLLRELSAGEMSDLVLFWAICGFFSNFDFGVGKSFIRELKLRRYAYKTVLTAVSAQSIIGILVLTISVITVFVGEYYRFWYSVFFPVFLFSSLARNFFEAKEDFFSVSLFSMFNNLILFIIPLIFLLIGVDNINAFILVICFLRFLSLCFLTLYIVSNYQEIKKWKLTFSFEYGLSFLKKNKWMAYNSFLVPVSTYLDRFCAGVLLEKHISVVYMLPMEFLLKIQVVYSLICRLVYPAFSENRFKIHRSYKLYMQSILIVYFISLIILFCVLNVKLLLSIWLGEEFSNKAGDVVKLMLISISFSGITVVSNTFLISKGYEKFVSKYNFYAFFVYLFLIVILTNMYSVFGLAMAYFIRAIIDSNILYLYSVKKFRNKNIKLFLPLNFIYQVVYLLLATIWGGYVSKEGSFFS